MADVTIKLVDKSAEFLLRNQQLADMTLAHIAQDMEIHIKTAGRTPFKKGPLRSYTRHERKEYGREFSVIVGGGAYGVEYAMVQELGRRAGAAPFRHYTTPGTGPRFIEKAFDATGRHFDNYVKEAASKMGMR